MVIFTTNGTSEYFYMNPMPPFHHSTRTMSRHLLVGRSGYMSRLVVLFHLALHLDPLMWFALKESKRLIMLGTYVSDLSIMKNEVKTSMSMGLPKSNVPTLSPRFFNKGFEATKMAFPSPIAGASGPT
jgi:hypothetical protein